MKKKQCSLMFVCVKGEAMMYIVEERWKMCSGGGW